jgi:hypothetical protein
VDCDIHCPLCEEDIEDDLHTFFTCVSVRSSWQAADLSSVMDYVACQQGSTEGRMFALCRNEDYATIGRVATLFWSIWQCSHDDHDVPILSTDRWKKPRVGWLKCNVDVAFFVRLGRTTMGACFRNSSGEFTAGLTQ